MQRLPGDSWHLWLPQWTRQRVLPQAPSWLCWGKTGEICLPSAGCIGWQHSAGGWVGGSSMTLGLKMIIFCTWKLGVGMSKAIIWIPDIPIRCPVPSGSPTNNQLQVPVPSCAAWGKVSDFSEPWLPHRKNREKRVREIRIGNWQGCYEEG